MDEGTFQVGAYSIPEAARLIDANAAQIRRWVSGYRYRHDDALHLQPPLWRPQHEEGDSGPLLGFRDLIEARIVRALRKQNIGLQSIRICLKRAQEIVDDERPFSSARFKTDGKSIFLEITEGLEEPRLIDLKKRQHVFRRIVKPSFKDLEFDEEAAVRWWPVAGKQTVVIDPTRAFGQPIVASRGISTERLKEAVDAEGSIDQVARLYDLTPQIIRDALDYQETLRAA